MKKRRRLQLPLCCMYDRSGGTRFVVSHMVRQALCRYPFGYNVGRVVCNDEVRGVWPSYHFGVYSELRCEPADISDPNPDPNEPQRSYVHHE